MRIDKHQYYLNIAEAVAARATCLHRQYGAVLVKNDSIIATGYNGAPRGEPNCCDIKTCRRDANALPVDADAATHLYKYDSCVAVHAEQNAMLCAAPQDMRGATLYLATTDSAVDPVPCNICNRMLKNAGVEHIITRKAVL